MAFEQNPYAIKITLIPDSSTVSAVAGQRVAVGIPFTAQQLTTGPAQNPFVFQSASAASANSGKEATVTLPATVTATANPVSVGASVNLEGFGAPYNGQFAVSSIGGSASAWTFNVILAVAATGQPSSTTGIVRFVTGANESFSTSTPVTASTQRPVGILQNQPYVWFDANGNLEGVAEAEITVSGVTKMVAGANILPGQVVTIDGSGRAIAYASPYATATAATAASALAAAIPSQYIIGTALTAGVLNDVITVAVACHNASRGY